MKHIFALTILLMAAVCIYGQQPASQSPQCSVKLAQSPAVRGIRLGMRLDDVLATFPGSRENEFIKNAISNVGFYSGIQTPARFGVVNFGVLPSEYATKNQFAGIESFYFTFVDERLVNYQVQYPQPPWPKIDEFIEKIAGAFNLPPADKWTTENFARKNLACDGFTIQAYTQDGRANLILKTGDDPFAIQRERRAAAEAQARREFRP